MNAPRFLFRLFLCLLLPLVAAGATSCAGDGPEQEKEEVTPQIIFLFSPGGLGDMSYNDCILEGVQKFKKNNPQVDIFMSSPTSLEEAERIFTDWLKRPGSQIPVVFALASSDYEFLLDRYEGQYQLTPNKQILLFESLRRYADDKIHTFQISMYGASYLAGATARTCSGERKSLVLLGSSADGPIVSAMDGFLDGYGRRENCDVEYLSSDWSGFMMPTYTYRNMDRWAMEYGFIFPVAGGSNAGIYRYSREFADCPFLAGMDIDQSSLSNKITGSVIKRFDVVIEEYFTQWLRDGAMPPSQLYGLESGYVDWLLSPVYETEFRGLVDSLRDEASAKEKSYYEMDF